MIKLMMVDDDEDDRLMFKEAMEETRLLCDLRTAFDGQDLIDQLRASSANDLPDLILLDLNMPRMDGREALQEIKNDENFRSIPIVIMTTSSAEEDIIRSYDCGASSFVPKPVTFEGLQEKIIALTEYWFDVVSLPTRS